MKGKKCKTRIYCDGDYTECSKCKNLCDKVRKCAKCGEIKSVAYEKYWDSFLCDSCYGEEVRKYNYLLKINK